MLGAIYYGLLSVVGTILIDAFLTIIGIEEIVPLFKTILLGMVVASVTGALFGKRIIHCPKPYMSKTFWTGFTMVMASLPFFALGLVMFIDKSAYPSFSIKNFQGLIYSYFLVLSYSYILFGFLLAIGAGLASIYLRGWLVYDILHTDKRKSMSLPQYVKVHTKSKTVHKAHAKPQKRT